jgi:p-aminobenzoyl-glutamate transporter AbgT
MKLNPGHIFLLVIVIVFVLYLIIPSVSAKAILAIIDAILVAIFLFLGTHDLNK